MENARTLLLSQGYEPIKVISWQRAVTLLFLGKVEILESYDGFATSTTMVIKIPAVVRLLRMFKKYRKPIKFSRINVYARDKYTCQYCGEKKKISELTYDHVIPRAQGGKTEWLNIVSACEDCNRYKGGRTPGQAGMKLRRPPQQPKGLPAIAIEINRTSAPAAWRDYAYWTCELAEE
jgi:5-methylcytosine-specific restriction endonuclease McrA